MALQLKRGPTGDRVAYTPVIGELVWDTDTNALYIGDGSTPGGIAASSITYTDAQDAAGAIFTSGTHSGLTFSYDLLTHTISSSLDLTEYDGVIRASSFNGTLVADDSTDLVDATRGLIVGNIASQSIKLGDNDTPDLSISSDVTSVNLETSGSRDIKILASNLTFGSASRDSGLKVYNLDKQGQDTVILETYFDGNNSNFFSLNRARGTSTAPTVLADADSIYRFRFSGYDGTDFVPSSQINSVVNGTPSTGVVPGKLQFLTADAAGTLRSALEIDSLQDVKVRTTLTLDNSSQTLTVNQSGQTSKVMLFTRSRGSSTVPTVVQANDHIYSMRFSGHDGSANQISSQIRAEVDSAASAGIVPGRLRFLTADSLGALTTAILVDSQQTVQINKQLAVLGTFKPPILSQAEIDALTPEEGMMVYNSTDGKFQGYAANANNDSTAGWADLH